MFSHYYHFVLDDNLIITMSLLLHKTFLGMFNSLCEKVEKILYRNFKNDTKAEIDKILDICQKEKIKYESKFNNMKME